MLQKNKEFKISRKERIKEKISEILIKMIFTLFEKTQKISEIYNIKFLNLSKYKKIFKFLYLN